MLATQLINEFQIRTKLQYSGKLNIKTYRGNKWSFYYYAGQIIWATGGTHPFRRWRRQMAQYCPEIDIDKMYVCSQDISIDYWDYRLLESLYNQDKIKHEQMIAVIENTIAELLFDLAQQANYYSMSCDRNQEIILEALVSFTSGDKAVKLMQESWENWSEAGLANLSPNLAPIVKKPELLQKQVSSAVYKNLVTLINGKYTLWDLAVTMKQSLISLVHSLLPYISKGMIELVEVFDLPLQVIEAKDNSVIKKLKTSESLLIACVNNNSALSQTLEDILINHGFRFINIQDTIHALPILIEHRPNLIFLNLALPVASGYEICAQLRRVSLFANTPIVMLADNDTPLDRIRAKAVGFTDLLAQPISVEKLINMVRNHTQSVSELVISQ